jgi:hypothetical protein
MQVSEIFSMGGRGGGCGCDCGGGRHGFRSFSRFGDFNNRHFGFRRSSFFDGGFRRGRFHHDRDRGSLIDIDIL